MLSKPSLLTCPSSCWKGQLALSQVNTKRCAVLNQRKGEKKIWLDPNTNSYFSQLPVRGSDNNEPHAGQEFLQTLLQNGPHKQTFPPAPVPAPQTTTANALRRAEICKMNEPLCRVILWVHHRLQFDLKMQTHLWVACLNQCFKTW